MNQAELSIQEVLAQDLSSAPDGKAWRDRLIDIVFVPGLLMAGLLFVYAVGQFLKLSTSLLAEGAPWWVALAPLSIAGLAFVAGSRWLILLALSHRFHRRLSHQRPKLDCFPLISILVPAYNEQENIAAAIESLITLDYPNYEVLIVDDGSTDETLKMAQKYDGNHGNCCVRVLHKSNEGKWSALNYGFGRSLSELVLCVDADSILSRDALQAMAAHMTDPGVAGVAGQVCVRNRDKLLTRLQGMEYILANGALRMAQADSSTVLVVPGPIGMFRRTALEEVELRLDNADGSVISKGPFQSDTFAEDFDLSLSVLSLGGRIVYEPMAISYTRAPDTPLSLMNQRYRWCRGSLQTLRKYFRRRSKLGFDFNSRVLIWVSGTYLFDLLLQPVLFLASIVSMLLLLWQLESPLTVVGFLALFQVVNLFAGIMYVCMHRDTFSALLPLPIYDFYQGFFINFAWLISVLDEIRGGRMRWT